MLYARVTEADHQTLCAEMKKATETGWYRRLKIIDLSAQGRSVPELATLFDLSEATIRDYIHRYNLGGIAGLQPDYG